MSHYMDPQSLTPCICAFTNGRQMMCTPGWMLPTPPLAMQSVQVGPAASSRLHRDPPPFSQVTSALCLVPLDIPPLAEPLAYVHDASWYPGHYCSGGALAILNVVTGVYKLYPVHIPFFCNNSYQAEVYVVWVVLQSRVPSASAWRGALWTFSDSQSYISAVDSRNEGCCPFVSAMLLRYRAFCRWEVPRHLYSHLQGTFLDEVLERVNAYAKDVALQQRPAPGWIAGLREPIVCFVDTSAPRPYQVHDPLPLFRHRLCRYLREAVSLPPIEDNPCHAFYSDLVIKGFLTWGVHLMVVAIRHDVGAASDAVCPFCGAKPET